MALSGSSMFFKHLYLANVVALKHVWPVKSWTPAGGARASQVQLTGGLPSQEPVCFCGAGHPTSPGLLAASQTLPLSCWTSASYTDSGQNSSRCHTFAWPLLAGENVPCTAFKIWSEGLQNSLPPNGLRSESQVTNLELQIHFPGHPLSPAKSAALLQLACLW